MEMCFGRIKMCIPAHVIEKQYSDHARIDVHIENGIEDGKKKKVDIL
jgi:hypothetical protein